MERIYLALFFVYRQPKKIIFNCKRNVRSFEVNEETVRVITSSPRSAA